MRDKKESGKRTFARKNKSMKKLAIATSKIEEHVVTDLAIKLAEAKGRKRKTIKVVKSIISIFLHSLS